MGCVLFLACVVLAPPEGNRYEPIVITFEEAMQIAHEEFWRYPPIVEAHPSRCAPTRAHRALRSHAAPDSSVQYTRNGIGK
ncbi:MAG: hypothetical protein R3C68_05900 [Myxococcota bacterium]